MNKSRVSNNYIIQLTYQILVNMVIPVVTIYWLTRTLGADKLGTFNYLNSWASYFVLFALMGTSQYGQREIAYRQNSRKEYSRVFFSVQYLRMILSSISILLWFAFSLIFDGDKLILLILSLNILNVATDISWFYIGLEDFITVIKRSISVRLIYTAAIFILIKGPEDIYRFVLIEAGFFVLVSLSLWPGVFKRIDFVKCDNLLRHFKGAFLLFLPALATQLYSMIDKTMIGLFSVGGYSENAYYELTQNMVKAGLFFSYTLSTVMLPRISNTIAENNIPAMKKHLYRSYNFTFLTSIPIAVIIFAIAKHIVPIYFGNGYESVITLARIMSPVLIAAALAIVTGQQYFIARDRMREYTSSLIIGCVLNIILNLLLIPRFLATGAACASVVSEWSIAIVQLLMVLKIGDLKVKEIFRLSRNYIISASIMGIYFYLLRNVFTTSIISILIQVSIGLILYFLTLILLKDSYAKFIIHKLFSIFKTKKAV